MGITDEIGVHPGSLAPREIDESSLITHGIAVIRSTEHGDAIPVVSHFVAIFFDLVRSDDVIEIVEFEEVFGDVGTKLGAHTSFGGRSTQHGLRIRPEEFTHDTIFGWLFVSLGLSDVIQSNAVLLWREIRE